MKLLSTIPHAAQIVACPHGHRGYCGSCAAEIAPKCAAHGHPWICGLCNWTAPNDEAGEARRKYAEQLRSK